MVSVWKLKGRKKKKTSFQHIFDGFLDNGRKPRHGRIVGHNFVKWRAKHWFRFNDSGVVDEYCLIKLKLIAVDVLENRCDVFNIDELFPELR